MTNVMEVMYLVSLKIKNTISYKTEKTANAVFLCLLYFVSFYNNEVTISEIVIPSASAL